MIRAHHDKFFPLYTTAESKLEGERCIIRNNYIEMISFFVIA